MAYTKNVWLETSMTAAQKVTALNNLETMYTQAISYIDAITHSSSYYTEAQADAKYFTSLTDGPSSGLICATLDGYTAQGIIDAGTPSGCICWWSGSAASIPSGWVLCDGSNSTPNLRDRFVVGAGGNYAQEAYGGANTVTTTATITIASHALTAAEMPLHSHGTISDYYASSLSSVWSLAGTTHGACTGNSDTSRTTASTGSGTAHDHGATWDGTDDQEKMPPYYALCAIMKS